MSQLCQRNKVPKALVRNKGSSLHWGVGIKDRRPITVPTMHLLRTLTRNRREKVFMIQQQLAEGTYDLDRRLNLALDRLLQDVFASDSPATKEIQPGVR
ncbi:MAG: hypothetical protein JXA82_17695 [Sedimentisphaerales bacterium]|nr:hypothetical protein [Sedimentisphaerales bacterium]